MHVHLCNYTYKKIGLCMHSYSGLYSIIAIRFMKIEIAIWSLTSTDVQTPFLAL